MTSPGLEASPQLAIEHLRVLLVEDSPDDAALIERALLRGGYDVEVARVDSRGALRARLGTAVWDVVLCDHVIPGFSSALALEEVRGRAPGTPFIVVSGRLGEEAAVEIMQCGAWGYVPKDALPRLVPVVQRALRERATQQAHATAERRLAQRNAQFQALFENSIDAMLITDDSGALVEVNDAGCRMLGRRREELVGRPATDFAPLDMRVSRGEARLRLGTRDARDVEYSAQADVVPGRHLTILRDVTDRNAAVREVARSRERLAEAQRLAQLGSYELDLDRGLVRGSAEALRLVGLQAAGDAPLAADAVEALMLAPDRTALRRAIRVALRERRSVKYEVRVERPDGAVRVMSGQVHATPGDHPRVTGVVRDVTDVRAAEAERALLQRKLDQAQRLESLGQLAGGVAHDFNNLLAVIINYVQFAADQLGDDPIAQDLETASDAARQAADLTRQLLVFSCSEPGEPRIVDLAALMASSGRLLDRTLGEQVDLRIDVADALWPVRADGSRIEQVVLNLAVNARDAMPDGGTLAFSAANVKVEGTTPETVNLAPGPYVLIQATDSGCGMSPGVAARAFDPFFTTKGPGKGTGLGLATVYGIASEAGGVAQIASEEGVGTTISVYLPAGSATDGPAVREAPAAPERAALHGMTVVVVEDEESVRELTVRLLQAAGCDATGYGDGFEALRHPAAPDVVVTDMVMPRIGGTELAARVERLWPRTGLVLTSGYVDTPDALPRNATFLPKPFTRGQLLEAIRAARRGRPRRARPRLDRSGLPAVAHAEERVV